MAKVRASGWAWACLSAGVVAASLVLTTLADASDDAFEHEPQLIAAFDAKLHVIAKTDRLLADKFRVRADALARRVRASYMLLRADEMPLWLDSAARTETVQRRALVKRLLTRAGAELALLRDEVTAAARARAYLEGARARALDTAAAAGPIPGMLLRPVEPGQVQARFEVYIHPTGARLTRRGVELTATLGAPVYAPADGIVDYAGRVRGLGWAIVIDHGDYRSVVSRLQATSIMPGVAVAAGASIGKAAGEQLYFEVRLDTGGGGHPIDPGPLFVPLSP